MSPYTPLHDVNVTSIYSNTRTHILIFLYKTNLPFDLQLEKGEEQMWFSPSILIVSRSKIHIYSCSQHILMTTITPTTSIKSSISIYSKSIKVFQNTDLRIYSNFTFYPLGKDIGNDVNVTSIYSNTRTHILIFLYKTNLCFDLQLERGEEQMWFSPSTRFGQKSTSNTPSQKNHQFVIFIDHLVLII